MKKNVASQVVGAQMITAADGTAFTGSVTVSVTGDGGTQATGSVGSGACAHEGNGFHTYVPAQAETNYDHVAFTFTGTGAIPATVQAYTSFPQTGDNFARLGAPAGASVSADIAALPTAAENADAVWDEVRSGHTTAGTFGGDQTDAPSNFSALAIDASGNLTGTVGGVAGDVTGNVNGSVGSLTTNNDKTGYALSGTQTFNMTGNITGNLSGSVGSVTTVSDKTGYTLSNTGMDNLLTRAMTEAYSTDGGSLNLATALYEIAAMLQEKAVSGTTLTVNKRDGTTPAMTFTLDDATAPTSITRTS